MPKFEVVNDNLTYEGKFYPVGEVVNFTDKEAKAIGSDVLKPVKEKGKTKETGTTEEAPKSGAKGKGKGSKK